MNEIINPVCEIECVCVGLERAVHSMNIILDKMFDDYDGEARISEYISALSLASDRVFDEKNKLGNIAEAILKESKGE